MTWEDLHPDLNQGLPPRVFATQPDDPQSGRVFVWGQARWFERVESPTENGAVEFTPFADSEEELREHLMELGLDIDELDDDFARMVRDEFENEVPLYPEAEEESLSDREP
jgi:hypothetical protein